MNTENTTNASSGGTSPRSSRFKLMTGNHRGRIAQVPIYLGKNFRMFIFQNDWKVLPMSALIAALIAMVVGQNMYVTMEGQFQCSLALTCICIWNGFFNSVQSVCRERPIIKREHRSGMHISSYVVAHLIYQMFLCAMQALITVGVCKIAGIKFPEKGFITPWFLVDTWITMFLITYASDITSLFISSIVHTTTTAMTVMPFMLIFQLLFSGGFFQLEGFAKKITVLTVSSWGLNSLCAIGRYNEQPMVTLWNTIFKFKDIEFQGRKPLLEIILELQKQDKVNDILLWSGTYNTNDAYLMTVGNVLKNWGALLGLTVVFVVIAVIALEFIDRDTR